MDLDAFTELLTPRGQRALAEAVELVGADPVAAATRLRRTYDAALTSAALTQAGLRDRARAKFGIDAASMYFTPHGLEQATRAEVGTHRARRLTTLTDGTRAASGEVQGAARETRVTAGGAQGLASGTRVVDVCCGIGGDFIALARAGCVVDAVDLDPLTVAVARANAEALGLGDRVTVRVGDAAMVSPEGYDWLFADPARRTSRGRTFDPMAYSPPWPVVLDLVARAPRACLKVAPGIPYEFIPAGAEAEWVSYKGEVKEASLWTGSTATTSTTEVTDTTTTTGAPDTTNTLETDEATTSGAAVPIGAADMAGATDTADATGVLGEGDTIGDAGPSTAADTTGAVERPGDAVQPATQPDGAAPPATQPDDAAPPAKLPSSAVPPATQPNGAVRLTMQPNGAAPPTTQPNGAVPPTALPGGAVRRATLLPGGETLVARGVEAPIGPVGRYVYEPDGAAIRAHLVGEVAEMVNGRLPDPMIAYITSDEAFDTPWAARYSVEEVLPFSLKRLRAALRERQIGNVVIKKRASAVDIERLRNDLRLSGDKSAVIILTRIMNKPSVLICQAAPPA
ncbi:THUMP-like domain-containing protein [Nonomuraea guangzhouensis]|uniref:Methyltransferase domain-containing protein n=1 Tax=Nonomuraea guangzhouensis TaxID=1291555 RepID=A0ABW4GJB5_9ACTN|nr:methyltransferase domain-containing protein [Nonomuraea guangzhouensis]